MPQTKRILQRISTLTHKLPLGISLKPQRTQIFFLNGSSIEVFRNNPETIRGPTLQVVYPDEFNFITNDQELYDAILYTLAATNGKFVCSSRPWHTDSRFFKIFNYKDFSRFKTSHVLVERILIQTESQKKAIIQKSKPRWGDAPSRWRREMQAGMGRRRRRLV